MGFLNFLLGEKGHWDKINNDNVNQFWGEINKLEPLAKKIFQHMLAASGVVMEFLFDPNSGKRDEFWMSQIDVKEIDKEQLCDAYCILFSFMVFNYSYSKPELEAYLTRISHMDP